MSTSAVMNTPVVPGKRRAIGFLVLRGTLAFIFLLAGGTKLAAVPPQPEQFVHWGYPLGFMYVVGLLVVSGAIGLLVRRVSGFAALLLVGVMVGAAGTLVRHGEYSSLAPSLLFLVLLLGVASAQRDMFRRLVTRGAR